MITHAILTPPKYRAIAALLTCDTQLEAAKEAHVNPRSIRLWMNDPEFVTELAYQRAMVVDAAATIVIRGMTKAAKELVKLAETARSETARVAACRTLLEFAKDYNDQAHLMVRLAQLEADAHAMTNESGFGGES